MNDYYHYGIINTTLCDDTIIDHFALNYHMNNWLADDFVELTPALL